MPHTQDLKHYKQLLEHNQDIQDLLDKIQFDTEHGQIWFEENRMLLIHSGIMGYLRKDLYQMLGYERTKHFFIRCGYQAGMRDAEVTSRLRPNLNEVEAFMAGPQMHGIRGMVQVTVNDLRLSHDQHQFYADFNWLNSFEAEVHLSEFGAADEPACWMLLGYACGYSSYVMGQTIIYQETHCVAKGDDCCRIIGKPLADWENANELIRFMSPDPVSDKIIALQAELNQLKQTIYTDAEADYTMFNAIGESAAYRKVCDLLKKAAGSNVAVLLQGETGVGKEAFARGIHQASQRRQQPFVAVNCACIPPDLIEAELFGVEKGAYTGANQSRAGKFERADGGTIFLDEVIELSPRAQAALLRMLQEGEFERVGDYRTRKVDVRIVAATNEDLEQAVKAGRFRADLFYRLNIFPVQIPPLRERREDIPLLVNHFLKRFENLYGKALPGLSDKAKNYVMSYEWPGNIRELENLLERATLLTDDQQEIKLSCLFPQLKQQAENSTSSNSIETLLTEDFSLERHEQEIILTAMQRSQQNISEAARLLGISRATLDYRLKKYQMV
ncbi:sigma-54-dependent Fis family transcriptional regulator [Acinetobacter indicus]|uniref:phenol degradation transcriptional regulator MobR n=1 Tax=Acinetobacter TaxID=469 RepID=UPI0015D1A745|nr:MULTISPECIES: phenol degradation transcriptional regulator MobR [Acinetobacter]MCP0915922.1 sigma-54-dependent Fis family transcriptional regulator [Acinetobacter indicus]MCP0919048.1 sigma-54-dependent Fis family transcriptional regulator [Acinetobacter indicus]MCP0921714.1 sigma-54-dependent Fis family transcriptional regulator [Acinetobacter indicus]QSQ93926.1 sigma-54-dependent Fis family transcriptional regulator [Acinetobacter indicus]